MNELTMTAKDDRFSAFFPVLQRGFGVRVDTGSSVKALLCDQWGLDAAYVDRRIQTVFLESKPVDDLQTAVVTDGATLALSAAMPGLVGAVMRSGGVLAPFRRTISHCSQDPDAPCREGTIVVKLFNLLVRELGGLLLSRGILVSRDTLAVLLGDRPADFWKSYGRIELDGKEISGHPFPPPGWINDQEPVLLKHFPADHHRFSKSSTAWVDT